ncbi:Hypothetical Protein FCC1311_076212 [Hondaea fermentalgiana]|uniref:Uncharacterized protein n=1 Tax=Hondaea fermentalgiana TaxID=2315210 RepID=A0A2R5GKJ0_9STRA|nr:Hypothetical Protein FCC1311_076212 [Hondaea fermentalgiana]|eukprot:GBG31397.1 Hypothetical Protein FCC1311_076212 [Hondaea fermentalgiana]
MAPVAWMGLSEAVSLALIVTMALLAAPLPRSVVETALAVRPGLVMLIAAASTSLVPFAESVVGLVDYKPRSDAHGYESDPRWQTLVITTYRSSMVGALLLTFVLFTSVCSRLVKAQAAEERMGKNLQTLEKQAKAGSAQSIKMLHEAAQKAGTDGGATEIAAKLEKLMTENARLKREAEAATKECNIIKEQSKAFKNEHERLIDQIAKLEAAADKVASAEPKKDR